MVYDVYAESGWKIQVRLNRTKKIYGLSGGKPLETVVYFSWLESVTVNHEVVGSNPSATVYIFRILS